MWEGPGLVAELFLGSWAEELYELAPEGMREGELALPLAGCIG